MQHHHHHTDHPVASMMAMGGADDDSSSHHLLCGYNDSGMIMYMDGFQWTLKGKGSCLNFFVESWKLDTVSRFVASMVFVVAMGIATEGINRWKHNVAQKLKRNVTNNNNHNKLRGMHTCLQGMSILSAYLLMLVVMTYSLELLLCVILGLMVGYFVFDGDSFHHGGGTPCCNFNVMDGTEAGSTTTTSMITEPLLPRTTSLGGSSDSNNSHRPATTLSDGTMESFEHSCCNNNDGSGSQNDEEEI